MNDPLRDDARHDENKPCSLAVTSFFADRGIKKLRANNIKFTGEHHVDEASVQRHSSKLQKPKVLWRGMRNLDVSQTFMDQGGTEMGFMSTTTSLEVAVKYSLAKNSLLLKIVPQTFMATGADVSWLSAFPSESEMLYPPLTYLRPTGAWRDVVVDRADGMIIKFRVIVVEPTV